MIITKLRFPHEIQQHVICIFLFFFKQQCNTQERQVSKINRGSEVGVDLRGDEEGSEYDKNTLHLVLKESVKTLF